MSFFASTRRRRWTATVLLALGIAGSGALLRSAAAVDANADAIRTGLQSFGAKADELASDPTLAEFVALTGFNPAGPDGLDLDSTIGDVLDAIPPGPTSLADLESDLEGLDGDYGGVTVTVGCPAPATPGCVPVDVTDTAPFNVLLPITLSRTRNVPLALDTTTIDLAGGEVPVALGLSTLLQFAYDPSVANAALAFSMSPATANVDVDVDLPDGFEIAADFGFTEVQITEGATPVALHLDLDVSIADPDSSGQITQDEWTTTAIADLVTVAKSGSATGTFDVDSPLTTTAPDVNELSVADADLGDGFQPPAGPSLGSLGDFANVSGEQAVAGLGQVAAALSGLKSAGDPRLPFLQDGLGETLDIAGPLLALVNAFAVSCGTVDGTPPTGAVSALAAGTTVYCQAKVNHGPTAGTIIWSSHNGTALDNASGAAADGTIATAPTKSFSFTMDEPGTPEVSATYTQGGSSRTVARAPVTAQALFDELEDRAGFADEAGEEVQYDEASKALTFRLKKTFDPPATLASGDGSTTFDFGSQLASLGIEGLNPTGTASVVVDSGQVTLDLTFGIFLTPSAASVDPADNTDPLFPPGDVDRFFLKAGPGHELSYSSLSLTPAVELSGQIGYLEIGAEGSSTAPDPHSSGDIGTAFQIFKPNGADPALAVDIAGAGVPVDTTGDAAADTTVADAVLVRKLLNDLPGTVAATVNLGLKAGLEVGASLSGTQIASGKVGIHWPDVATAFDPATDVEADAAFLSDLGSFAQIDPSNPQALLSLILDNLDGIVAAIDGVSGGAFTTRIPLVGASPKDLLEQFQQIETATDELRGSASADIVCGTQDTDPPSMPPNQHLDTLVFGAGSMTQRIYCQGVNPKAASAVEWSVTNGTVAADDDQHDDVDTVRADPTENFAFDVTNKQLASEANPTGWRVELRFTDEDGEHDVDLPDSSAPTTLQKLEDAIEEKLGIPEQALAFELKDFSGTRHVVLRLNFSQCTTGNSVVDTCAAGDKQVPKEKVPLAFDLGGAVGGLVDANSSTFLDLEYIARAKLNVAIPLTTNPTPTVLDSSGVELQAGLTSDSIDLNATVGPLTVAIGTSATTDGTPASPIGKLRLGAKFALANTDGGDGVPDDEADEDPIALGSYASGIDAAFANPTNPAGSCGQFDHDYDGTADFELSGGAGCLIVSASLGATDLDEIGVKLNDIPTADFDVYTSPDLASQIASALLDWNLLLQALPELLDKLEATLDGTASGVKIPLVGDALDAGADVVGKLNANVVTPLVDLANQITAAGDSDADGDTDALDVKDAVQKILFDALNADDGDGVDLLQPRPSDPAPLDQNDVGVTLLCSGGAPCVDSDPQTVISDVRVTFTIGQGAAPGVGCAVPADCVAGAPLPFDIGLDGLPVRLTGTLAPQVGWRANLDFGLSRSDGPYLVTGGDGHQSGPEVVVGAAIALGDAANPCPAQNAGDGTGTTAGMQGFSTTRCLEGTLGFLGVTVWDGDGGNPVATDKDDPTSISIKASLDLTGGTDAPGLGTRIKILDIPTQLGADLKLEGGANVDALVRTGLKLGETAGLPSVVGTLHLNWSWAAPGEAPTASSPTISFEDLHLDAGEFITQFLDPIVDEIRNLTAPLKPFVDTLQAEIPVVSDLAKLVGADPVRLIDLMEAVSGSNLDVVKSVIAFLDFVNNLPTDAGLIPLGPQSSPRAPGSFSVDPAKAKNPQTPDTATGLIGGPQAGGNLLSEINGNDAAVPAMVESRPSAFGVPGLSFPFMDDATNIFGILMGADITLVRYDLGNMEATAGFSHSFGPFFIGPVPVTANIGGSATIRGRFAFGYDTSGLRKVLEGGSGEHLFDGIFIDDLDAQGIDVAEVQFVGEVFAGASVNILIFEAGIDGGIRLSVGLNLNDSPDPDGKLRIEEIVNKLHNPICLFDVEGRLVLFLRAFLEIDLFLTSSRAEFELLNIVLLDFTLACSPPEPVLAEPVGSDLVLNIGSLSRREARGINVGEEDETVVVRPVDTNGRYSVSMFGEYQVFGPGITRIVADGGSGDDNISLLPGGEATVDKSGGGAEITSPTAIPFTAVALISGGSGIDSITTGDGDDTITGGTEGDKINAGGGNDLVNGDDGDDQIDGGFGDDTRGLNGGDGTDAINGGPGGDTINGGPGNDVLNGGPSSDVAPGPGQPDPRDKADLIIGDAGSDNINGNDGDDELHGGFDILVTKDEAGVLAACSNGSGPAFSDSNPDQDQIHAGPGDDWATGGPDKDQVIGGEGNDRICGNGGNDLLEGDSPTPGNDFLHGGPANDILVGFAGDDVLMGAGGDDSLDGGEGNDDLIGGTGADVLSGGSGRDIAVGDNGTIGGHLSVVNHVGSDHDSFALRAKPGIVTPDTTSTGNSGLGHSCAYDQGTNVPGNGDCIYGGADADYLFGERGPDQMFGDDGEDYLEGNADSDLMRGGNLGDTMLGNDGPDEVYGDSGDDKMFGNEGCDVMRGNQGDDDLEGNGGADTMNGDAGQDNLVGGSSSPGAEDDETDCDGGGPLTSTGDTIYGNAGTDAIAGDNATITGVGTVDTDDDPAEGRTVVLHDVDSADATVAGPDTIEGNEANDLLFGQGENDTLHGNAGGDRMQGNAGTDTMHGGIGVDLMLGGSDSTAGPTSSTDDAGDVIDGNNGDDVVVGDNGDIAWDKLVTPPSGEDPATFGNDTLRGNGGKDQMFGELGDDVMDGDGGTDFMLGDRGVITQATTTQLLPGGAPQHSVTLFAPETGGSDTMRGDGADDRMYGGWATDTMEGGPDDDYMEGNGGSDTMFGLAENPTADEVSEAEAVGDQDDMIGGTSGPVSPDPRLDDGELVMEGNLEQDVMAGDNANIVREVDPNDDTAWLVDNITGGAKRNVELLDREKSGSDLAAVGGGDTMLGNEGNDRMYGESDDDCMKGNDADDYLEGNQGSDWMEGNDGEDDLIGGSSFPAVAQPAGVGDPDADDDIFGGGDDDFIMGDNAIVTRDENVPGGPYHYDTVSYAWLPPAADRFMRFYDLGVLDPVRFGDDRLAGGSGADVMFGQDGDESMYGGTEDDYMEGNGGADTLHGDQDRPPSGDPCESPEPALNGVSGSAGQDDQIGGSSLVIGNAGGNVTGHRDRGDEIHGNGNADYQLGDNGRLLRRVVDGSYKTYFPETARHTIVRQAAFQPDPETRLPLRYDVGTTATPDQLWGADALFGDDGDDYQFGQDGDDTVHGGNHDDDQYGELGGDFLFGDSGQDAQIGDRGTIINRLEDGSREITYDTKGPGFFRYVGLVAGQYDRRVTLTDDGDGAPQLSLGHTVGGNDQLRGGPGHDSMHGAFGDDLMNGDSGGDWLFGQDGADVMWGGKGADPSSPFGEDNPTAQEIADNPTPVVGNDVRNVRGENDRFVDFLFGGHGGLQANEVEAADILDFLPRSPGPGFPGDPDVWFTMTNTVKGAVDPNPDDDQYHQGIDWIYGGFNRDVLEGDVGKNGPDFGDRLIDWNGAFNLYTRCNASYGDDGDIRQHSPHMQKLLQLMAFGSGAGLDPAEVTTAGTSAFRELGLAYPGDKDNAGKAFPSTPGHFEKISCVPGSPPK